MVSIFVMVDEKKLIDDRLANAEKKEALKKIGENLNTLCKNLVGLNEQINSFVENPCVETQEADIKCCIDTKAANSYIEKACC